MSVYGNFNLRTSTRGGGIILPTFINEGSVVVSEMKSDPRSVVVCKRNNNSIATVTLEDVESYMSYSNISSVEEAVMNIARINNIPYRNIRIYDNSSRSMQYISEGLVSKFVEMLVQKLNEFVTKLFDKVKESLSGKIDELTDSAMEKYDGNTKVKYYDNYDISKLEKIKTIPFDYSKMNKYFDNKNAGESAKSGSASKNHIYFEFYNKFYSDVIKVRSTDNGNLTLQENMLFSISTQEEEHTVSKEDLKKMSQFVKSYPAILNSIRSEIKSLEKMLQEDMRPTQNDDAEEHKKANSEKCWAVCMADLLRAKSWCYTQILIYYGKIAADCASDKAVSAVKSAMDSAQNKSDDSSDTSTATSESVMYW